MNRGDLLSQICTNSTKWQAFWKGSMGLQLKSAQYWFRWIIWTSCNFGFVAWLDAALLKHFERVQGVQNCHLCSVGVSFVGLHEHTQTWLCGFIGRSATSVHKLLTLITQTLKLIWTGGSSFSNLHNLSKMASILKGCEMVAMNIGAILVCWIIWTPSKFYNKTW